MIYKVSTQEQFDELIKKPKEVIRLKVLNGDKEINFEKINELENLEQLNLSYIKMKKLPEKLYELSNLKILRLYETEIEEISESIGKLKNLEELDLSCIKMKKLPDKLYELSNLKRLWLDYTKIEEISESIGKLKNLEQLGLNFTSIKKLPEEICRLSNLKILSLVGRRVEELPESIGKLKNLEQLDLRHTRIKKLPEEIYKLSNLKILWLEETEIEEIPESIGRLKNLEQLDLSHTSIKKLPEEIYNLGSLKILRLSQTKIEEITESIGMLKNLEELDLNWTKIKKLPEEIYKLSSLKILKVDQTEIEEISESIGKLKKLEQLDLNRTKMKKLPEEIYELSNLKILMLYETEIEEISESIGKLKKLETLNLRLTKIKKLPENIGKLKKLHCLALCGCDLETLPKSLDELGLQYKKESWRKDGILINGTHVKAFNVKQLLTLKIENPIAYLLNAKTIIVDKRRIVVIGEGDAGKTSFIGTFTDENYDMKKTEKTSGVKITPYRNDEIYFWDFGGQEIYQSTHTLFLKGKPLFIIVLNGRADEKPDKWLEYIKFISEEDVKVIIVITKVDDNKDAYINEIFYKRKYPNIIGVFTYSAEDVGKKLESKDIIERKIEQLEKEGYFKESITESYNKTLQYIEEQKKAGGKIIKISTLTDKIEKILEEDRCEDEEEIDRFKNSILNYFAKTTGDIFINENAVDTSEYIVIDINWLLSSIYIFNDELEIKKGTYIRRQKEKLDKEGYIGKDGISKDSIATYISKIITDDKVLLGKLIEKAKGSKMFFPNNAPRKLDEDKTIEMEQIIESSKTNTFEFKYLPPYVLKKIMIKYYEKIGENILWYYGFVFEEDGEKYLIVEEQDNIVIYGDESSIDKAGESLNRIIEEITGNKNDDTYTWKNKKGEDMEKEKEVKGKSVNNNTYIDNSTNIEVGKVDGDIKIDEDKSCGKTVIEIPKEKGKLGKITAIITAIGEIFK